MSAAYNFNILSAKVDISLQILATLINFSCFAILPQFRSVFPCEAILCVEMSFWRLYMLIRGFSGLPGSYLGMKSPTQTNGEYENHKEMLLIQGILQNSMLYLYTGSERSAFLVAPILPAR